MYVCIYIFLNHSNAKKCIDIGYSGTVDVDIDIDMDIDMDTDTVKIQIYLLTSI